MPPPAPGTRKPVAALLAAETGADGPSLARNLSALRPGPAKWAAAVPVSTKIPAPTVAPTPRQTRLKAERFLAKIGRAHV